MATRTLEACFDRLSVNDENDPGENARLYQKTKVLSFTIIPQHLLVPIVADTT
jgi:aurora kinase